MNVPEKGYLESWKFDPIKKISSPLLFFFFFFFFLFFIFFSNKADLVERQIVRAKLVNYVASGAKAFEFQNFLVFFFRYRDKLAHFCEQLFASCCRRLNTHSSLLLREFIQNVTSLSVLTDKKTNGFGVYGNFVIESFRLLFLFLKRRFNAL